MGEVEWLGVGKRCHAYHLDPSAPAGNEQCPMWYVEEVESVSDSIWFNLSFFFYSIDLNFAIDVLLNFNLSLYPSMDL